jgi:regulator of protease activity HflC (stomatin/prohibitin superfamily)
MDRHTVVKASSGWLMVFVNFLTYLLAGFILSRAGEAVAQIVVGVLLVLLAAFMSNGFFIVNPNYSALLVLFGKYKGTVMDNGFFWANPLLRKMKISLRVRNQETARLKVNDKSGNPIDIAAVVVWNVTDPFRAAFEVDAYTDYVSVQSESALRHMASNYAYDGADTEVTLRGSTDTVSDRLAHELQERLDRAGVKVIEARLSHLAYAQEIAGEMLRRQQAEAVVAARFKIVEGAVGMVEHALAELSKKELVHLDEERKAAMVSNLLVVLCSESAAQPVVNTGTLYP